MLSNKEKREMLKDAKSTSRRDDFKFAASCYFKAISFDDYLGFLNDVQKIFAPFKISHEITAVKLNKL